MVVLQFIIIVFEQLANCKIYSVKYSQRVINTSKQLANTKR